MIRRSAGMTVESKEPLLAAVFRLDVLFADVEVEESAVIGVQKAAGCFPGFAFVRRTYKFPVDGADAAEDPDLIPCGVLRNLRVGNGSLEGDGLLLTEGEDIVGLLRNAVAQGAVGGMARIRHEDASAVQNAHTGGIVLIGVVAVELAQTDVTAGRLGAFGIQFLHVDLAHVVHIGDISQSVIAHDGALVDPPFGIGTLDLLDLCTFKIDHIVILLFI